MPETLLQKEHARGLHAGHPMHACGECPPTPAPEIVAPPVEVREPPAPAERRRQSSAGFTSLGQAIERMRARGLAFKATTDEPSSVPDGPPDGGPDCELCRGYRWVRRDLPILDPDFGKMVLCPRCLPWQIQRNLDQLIGGLPARYRDYTLGSYPQNTAGQRQALGLALEWLDDPARPWLFLYGRSGRGKTGLALGLLKVAMQRGRLGLFKDATLLLALLKSSYRSREAFEADETTIMSALHTVDLLVFDDLARGEPRDWPTGIFNDVIFVRHAENKQTIITCNWTVEELVERLGYPAVSRIQEAAGRYQLDFSLLPNLRLGDSDA